MRSNDQTLHDRINLPRVVKRLEHIVQDSDWIAEDLDDLARRDSWVKARGTLQQIRYARVLLKNVELDDPHTTPSSEKQRQHISSTITHLETYMLNIEKQLTPVFQRPRPILPSIPPPISHPSLSQEDDKPTKPSVEATLIPAEDNTSIPVVGVEDLISVVEAEDLIPATPETAEHQSLSDTHAISSPASSVPPLSSHVTATPTILQNSRALQEELSEQLALMAVQLRRNATHFSDSLVKDKTVVEAMQEKLESNFELLKKERTRLRDFRGKSGGTTCLVIMSVIVVVIAFIVMVFVIRVT